MSIVLGLAGVPVKVTLPLTVPASSRPGHKSIKAKATKLLVKRIIRILLQNLSLPLITFGHPEVLHQAEVPERLPGQHPWFRSWGFCYLPRAADRSRWCDVASLASAARALG